MIPAQNPAYIFFSPSKGNSGQTLIVPVRWLEELWITGESLFVFFNHGSLRRADSAHKTEDVLVLFHLDVNGAPYFTHTQIPRVFWPFLLPYDFPFPPRTQKSLSAVK